MGTTSDSLVDVELSEKAIACNIFRQRSLPLIAMTLGNVLPAVALVFLHPNHSSAPEIFVYIVHPPTTRKISRTPRFRFLYN